MTHDVDGDFISVYNGCMFVRVIKKNQNHVSVRIVKSVRKGSKVKQQSICCVGHTHKNNLEKIQLFKKVGQDIIKKWDKEIQQVFPGWSAGIKDKSTNLPEGLGNKQRLPDDLVHALSLKEKSRITTGIEDIFGSAYEQLNIKGCLLSGYKKKEVYYLLKKMVLARLESPISKKKTVQRINKKGEDTNNRKDENLKLDKVYRVMDKLYICQERIKNRIFDQTLSFLKQTVDVILFDVTTLYFESFREDELRQSGYSKDNKTKETQVVLALMTTTAGLPVSYELFPGRTYEGRTLIQTVDHISKSYDVRDISLVADRGMFSKDNLLKLEERGVGFIVGARLKSMKREVKEKILKDLEEVKANKSILSGEDKAWVSEYAQEEVEGHRLIVHFSPKRAEKDRKEREKILEKIRKQMKNGAINITDLVSNRGVKKYLKLDKKGSKQAFLNEQKIQDASQWDGISAVLTNKQKMSAKEVCIRYKDLWQIESAFRLNKHDLRMRPVYHWTPKRIQAHILICFIAYSLACFVRYSLKKAGINLSFERLKEELLAVQETVLHDTKSGKIFAVPAPANKTQKAIYKCFHKPISQTVRFLSS